MRQKDEGQTMEACLKDLLCARWENLHLVHDEIGYGLPHTIVELDGTTLTAAGKEAWADVLDAKVVRVFQGYSGLQEELKDYLQKLYEKYVPQAIREYLDDRIAREENARPSRPNRQRKGVSQTAE